MPSFSANADDRSKHQTIDSKSFVALTTFSHAMRLVFDDASATCGTPSSQHVLELRRQFEANWRTLHQTLRLPCTTSEKEATAPPQRDDRKMRFEQKRALSDAFKQLPPQMLLPALDIVRGTDACPGGDDDIVIDIDTLSDEVLWKLKAFVDTHVPSSVVDTHAPSSVEEHCRAHAESDDDDSSDDEPMWQKIQAKKPASPKAVAAAAAAAAAAAVTSEDSDSERSSDSENEEMEGAEATLEHDVQWKPSAHSSSASILIPELNPPSHDSSSPSPATTRCTPSPSTLPPSPASEVQDLLQELSPPNHGHSTSPSSSTLPPSPTYLRSSINIQNHQAPSAAKVSFPLVTAANAVHVHQPLAATPSTTLYPPPSKPISYGRPQPVHFTPLGTPLMPGQQYGRMPSALPTWTPTTKMPGIAGMPAIGLRYPVTASMAPTTTVKPMMPGGVMPGNERHAMWNHNTKRKISGAAAPMQKNLAEYLRKHPECELYDGQDLLLNPDEKKKVINTSTGLTNGAAVNSATNKRRAPEDTPNVTPSAKWQKLEHGTKASAPVARRQQASEASAPVAVVDPSLAAEELALLLAEDIPDFGKGLPLATPREEQRLSDGSSPDNMLTDDITHLLSDDISGVLADILV